MTLIHAPAGHVRGIVRGTKHAALRPVPIAFGHLKEVDDLALVPNVIAGGNDVNVQLKQLFSQRGRDAETGSGVLAIRNDKIDGLIADNAGQSVLDDVPSGPPEDIADEENPHGSAAVPAGIPQSSFDGNTQGSPRKSSATSVIKAFLLTAEPTPPSAENRNSRPGSASDSPRACCERERCPDTKDRYK